MTAWYAAAAVFLMLNLIAGLFRVRLGPTSADRLLAAQLLGTTGTALLLIMAAWLDLSSLVDTAIVFSLLATVTLLAFVCRIWSELPEQELEDVDEPD